MHYDAALPLRDQAGGDPHSYTTLGGTVRINIDLENESYSIDCKASGYDVKALAETITQAMFWGLGVVDEDEQPGEGVEDESGSWLRIRLAAKTGVL